MEVLGAALGRVADRLADGERALVIGHSPTNEAAILGLTGTTVEPIGEGGGVALIEEGGRWKVIALPTP